MSEDTTKCYCQVESYLLQGDIFALPVVAPAVDHRMRLFRSIDGRHGSVVFEGQENGTVFDPDDLTAVLARTTFPDPLHTPPFGSTPDGQSELVVVHARRLEYFVVATQSCDVSGCDGTPDETTVILPIRTLATICRTEAVPFFVDKTTQQMTTIHDYMTATCGCEILSQCANDDVAYGVELRKVLEARLASAVAIQKKNLNLVRGFINDEQSRGYLYWMQGDADYKVPECCIDFTAVYTVLRERLVSLMDKRIARITDQSRDRFAQQFAARISRIAERVSIKPRKV